MDPTKPLTNSPAQAAALLQVVDLEARWSNLQPSQPGIVPLQALNEKQRAYEAFRSSLSSYQSRFGATYESEPLLGNLIRLAAWCRLMRARCLEAMGDDRCRCPAHLLAKAYRIADRAGAKAGEIVPRPEVAPQTVLQVVEELEAVARWCDGLARVDRTDVRIPA